ncbi:two-component regulator propeller domain-containing protein [Colwellia sp. TT2012]|uniref:two-component regulator propeller domain-containing protein n=1 Tax=Colwellia sp. TT2012 TaxID=1720342 RepID=UPI0018D24126|nr:two-component regulator propeller domain-containing protein [Colwellia sp. TT2012]
MVYRFSLMLLLACSWQTNASIRFTGYDIEDGLSQNTVNAIIQDKYGFMWFGTQDGLNRFDGFEFETFYADTEDPSSLSNDYIYHLFIDQQGSLWIATRGGGLNRFNYDTETFDHFQYLKRGENSSYHSIQQIIQPNQNELWLATHDAGIQIFNLHSQDFSDFIFKKEHQELLSKNIISSLLLDKKNNLWLGTETNGLIKYAINTQSIEYFKHNNQQTYSLSDNQVTSIYQDQSQTIWVATLNGLNKYQPTHNNFQRVILKSANQDTSSHIAINDIKEDTQQRLWLATSSGLHILAKDRDKQSHHQHNPMLNESISGNIVYELYIAKNNILWLGLFAHGINKFNLSRPIFTHIYKDNTNPTLLQHDEIWSIFEDSQGEIWLGVDGGGLNHFNKKTQRVKRFIHNKNKNSLSSNRVWAIAESNPGVLWVGTYDAGLNLIDTNTNQVEHFVNQPDNDNSLIDNKILALYKDKEQNLWIGTKSGLDKLDTNTRKFSHFTYDPNDKYSLSFNYVLSIFEDSRDLLWISTYGGGLNSYNKKTQQFTRYQHDSNNANSISSNYVMSVSEDSDNNIWIATFGGINKLDFYHQEITRYGKKQGLANEATYAVLEGNDGAIWLSSNRGISRLDTKTNTFTNFTLGDGLQSYEFNAGAFLKASTGELYFGGINGFNIFNPQKVIKQKNNLSVTLTKMRVFNHIVSISTADKNIQSKTETFHLEKAIYLLEKLTLTHKESLVSFEFSTLDFYQDSDTHYEYMLENLDEKWIKVRDKSRSITYTNIPAGDYTLLLRARNTNTSWSKNITRLAINVKPPPWLSWWAYSGYIFIIMTLISLFFYQRYQRYLYIKDNEERLTLSLWGSNRELWDWHIAENYIFRINSITDNINGKDKFTLEHLKKTTHPDDINKVLAAFNFHINNESAHLDITYRRHDPERNWRWYRSRAKAVSRTTQGTAKRMVGTIEDVNELIEAQNQLNSLNEDLELRVKNRTIELSDALEELTTTQQQLLESEKMASLVGLVTGVAHELNTPLGVMLTAVSLLEHNQITLTDNMRKNTLTSNKLNVYIEHIDSCIKLINNNINKSIRLVKNFKALSYSSQNEVSKSINLQQLFKFIIKANSIKLAAKSAKVTVHCLEHIKIMSYPHIIDEVFSQLIENSCLHAFDNSMDKKIKIKITITDNSDEVQFIYQDNGEGLSDKLVGNIFDPFSTTKRGSDCIGLGMPIVYNQVTHNLLGTIKLSSSILGGLKIIIVLPKK